MTALLRSIAIAYPDRGAPQSQLADISVAFSPELADRGPLVQRLYAATSVAHRGITVLDPSRAGEPASQSFYPRDGTAAPTTHDRMIRWLLEASKLSLRSSKQALSRAAIAPHQITHLVTASCTGFAAPGVDHALIDGLALPATVERVNVGFMGCHAMINALRVARGLVAAEPRAVVLVVAAEVSSLHFQQTNLTTDQIIANALFADGSAACVVTSDDAKPAHLATLASTASCTIPASRSAMSWTVGDHGFVMTLAKEVPALIESNLRPWLASWLDAHGVAIADVRSWCVHPGGPKVLDSVERALSLPSQALASSRETLRNHGNMSSPTVISILERELQRDPNPWPCVLLAFGPGLTAEAALLQMS